MSEHKNLFFVMILSAFVLLLSTYFNKTSNPITPENSSVSLPSSIDNQKEESFSQKEEISPPAQKVLPPLEAPLSSSSMRKQILQQTPRILVQTSQLEGSINLKGGRFDDLELKKYHETIDKNSPSLVLFSPEGTEKPYHADTGWLGNDNSVLAPTHETVWNCTNAMLTPDQPIVLQWENGQGLVFEKHIQIDDKFMITITEKVKNKGKKKAILTPYSFLIQKGKPKTEGYFILHEGPLGVIEGALKETDYKKMQEQKLTSYATQGGWIGITDKYLLVALIPEQQHVVNMNFRYTPSFSEGYQVDYLYAAQVVNPGEEIAATHRIFSGAKILSLLDQYSEELKVAKLDLAIDFGWFYFLTKPLFHLLQIIHELVGNFGFAIIILTILVKMLFFPLANRSYRSMAMMKALQSEIEVLQKRYGDDKIKLNQEIMALYKRKNVNPLSGCLPIVLQFPVFFALYKVLFINIEMRHAPFMGWIQDLSAPDPTSLFNAFGLIPWAPPEVLMIGIWPLLMGITMVFQQRLNPQPADPVQAKMFMILPLVFTVMLARFPVGLVVYWTCSNILSILQQFLILRLSASPERLGVSKDSSKKNEIKRKH